MIPKIQPPNPNVEAAVRYNENKMDGAEGIRSTDDKSLAAIEDGHVLATRNVPDEMSLIDIFRERRLLSMKKKRSGPPLKEIAFHMSVNPSESDRPLSEKEAVELIDEMMASLGYKDQPYRIYKHTDIGREHYHVVSCRIDENGKKINDSFERLVLRDAMKKLAPKYGFEVILSEKEKQEAGIIKETTIVENITEEKPWPTKEKKTIPSFSRKNGSLTTQLKDIIQDSLKWRLTTFEQFQLLLLHRYKVLAEIEKKNNDEETLIFIGADSSGNPITPPISETELHLNTLRQLKKQMEKEKKKTHLRQEQRIRLERLARASAAIANSLNEFKQLMEKKGVIVTLSFTRDNEPFGITYLDNATKCAWKGSQTNTDLKWLKKMANEKNWTITKDEFQRKLEVRQNMPSRKQTINVRETSDTSETSTDKTQNKQSTKRLPNLLTESGSAGPLIPGTRTHGSTKQAGDGKEEKRKDIDDERPAELVQ